MALPTTTTPGYGYLYTYTSHPNVGCDCSREWVVALYLEAYRRGIVSSPTRRVIQAVGMASASALVHSRGGVLDLPFPDPTRWNSTRRYRVLGPKTKALLYLAREMGSFMWARYDEDGISNGDPWENNEHLHGGLNGCPHLHWQAKDQLTEYKNGGDGLVGSGRDPFPRPSTFRTWREGIAWAKAQANPTTTTTTKDWFDMATKADLQSVVRAELMRPAFLEEVARFVLTGYPFDHDNNSNTPKAVLAYAIQDMPDEVWEEKPDGNPNPLKAHVLNANIVATAALRKVEGIESGIAAIKKKLGI